MKTQLFISVILIVWGFYAIFMSGLEELELARATESWPTADGKILHSRLSAEAERTFCADVSYTYEVEGEEHTASRIWVGQYCVGDPETVSEWLEPYREGATVKVHYDPLDPDMAVLETGIKTSTYATVIGGAIAVLLGGVGLLSGIIKAWRSEKGSWATKPETNSQARNDPLPDEPKGELPDNQTSESSE